MGLPHYELRCQGRDGTFEDDGLVLECPEHHDAALLVADYKNKRFESDPEVKGIFRYKNWLPGTRPLPGAGVTVTYKSEKLNRAIGLLNVWVVFNGYWPERGATLETASFKDLEAWAVLSRIDGRHEGVLVLASAGNTAAAFAKACSLNKVPCLIVVPEAAFTGLRFPNALDPCVKIVSLTRFTDYSDAIGWRSSSRRSTGSSPKGV